MKTVVYVDEVEGVEARPDSGHIGCTSKGLVGKEVGAKKMGIAWNSYTPGGHTKPHSHSNMEQAFYFISGRGRIYIGDEKYEVRPGTAAFIPLNTPHSYENTGSEPLVFLLIEAYL